MRSARRGFIFSSVAAIALLGPLSAAWAADPETTDQIQEVTVTAQKTAQNIEKVPEAVSAFSSAQLRDSAIDYIGDIANRTPGLFFTSSDQGGSSTSFYIRGIGQDDFIETADPGVGVYLDGVYLTRTAGASLDLLDVDRVEVLRGPQGTVFGKNAVGGAVSVYTLDPTFTNSGHFQVRAGELGRFDIGGTISGPVISDTLAVRLTVEHRGDGGYGKSLYDGTSLSNQDETVARLTALWKITPTFSAELSFDNTIDNSKGLLATVLAINPNTFVTVPQNQFAAANGLAQYNNQFLSPTTYKNYSGFHPGNHTDIYGARLTLNDDLGWTQLKSITAFRGLTTRTGLDYDGSPFALGDQSISDRDHQFSQEFIATGKAFDNRLSWITGLYYLDEGGYSGIQLDLSYQTNPVGYDTFTTNYIGDETIAEYGQLTYNLTDKLSITGGLRYSYERKTDKIFVEATKFDAVLLPTTPQGADFYALTYRVGLQYQLTPTALAYGNIETGFKSGGFNGRAQSAGQFLAYDPEKARTYEIGARTELFDHRLRLNADIYQTDYNAIQTTLNVVDPITGVETNIIGNPANARIRGFEIESEFKFNRFFLIDAGVAYLDDKYTHLVPGADITSQDKLPFAPKWNPDLGAQLNLPTPSPIAANGQITARADYVYRGGTYMGAQNSQYNYQPGYGLVNLRIAYGPEGGPWEVAFYGRNLGNKIYYSLREDLYAFVYAIGIPASPREMGVELNYKF